VNTFSIITLGCKVNQYESQQIRELLERLGLNQTKMSDKVDVVVVNTCCVTRTASAKSRQYIRKAKKQSPHATIVLCGCLPTVEIGEMNNIGKDIHIVRHRSELAIVLSQIANGRSAVSNPQRNQPQQDTAVKTKSISKSNDKNNLHTTAELPQLTSFKGYTRAFLKVQDGCDGYCSYCIVPKTRPNVHSKPLPILLKEAQALVRAGHKEIVVTGVFLGAYGQHTVRRTNWPNGQNDKLTVLLDKMAKIPGLARIRLSSLEPADVTDRLLDTFCEHPNIMPHLHLSLQSGSDKILKKMARQYNSDDFRHKVDMVKSRLDRPAITSDIIVGFPGETDSDFEQTVSLAKEVGFSKMHVFGYSLRKGTAAALMQDIINPKVLKERSRILRVLDAELQLKYREQFIGEKVTILLEGGSSQPHGRSERYFMVQIRNAGKTLKTNDLCLVVLTENGSAGMIGELI
jgi:threonylcarbamoyladenosine tRNA methylthiotransferase MtaB